MKANKFKKAVTVSLFLIFGTYLQSYGQDVSISIFKNTIADMNWQQVKKASEEGAIILMTTAVIEEHGPHMGNGVDTYLGYQMCLNLQRELDYLGVKALIAPPLYWGMNRIGPDFPGSFYLRDETMKMLIEDILSSLQSWGFQNVYNINAHGDGNHIITGLKTFSQAKEKIGIEARYLFSDIEINRLGLTGREEFVLAYPSQEIESQISEYADIHAGGFETSIMVGFYPEYVDIVLAKTLLPTNITFQKLGEAFGNPEKYMPLGYIGDPASYTNYNGKEYLEEACRRMAKAIAKHQSK